VLGGAVVLYAVTLTGPRLQLGSAVGRVTGGTAVLLVVHIVDERTVVGVGVGD
jgi:hypothetical protein